MNSYILGIYLTLSLVFSGCLPMGLPEHFVDLSPQTSLSPQSTYLKQALRTVEFPNILIVVPNDFSYNLDSSTSPPTLGNQYVLGIFPLTRLFLQHSKESLLIETLMEQIVYMGYQPLLVKEKYASLAVIKTQPIATISPSITGLSINGYDLIFLRQLNISGTVELSLVNPISEHKLLKLRSASAPIRNTIYRKKAHAPALAFHVQRSTAKAIDRAFSKLMPKPKFISKQWAKERTSTISPLHQTNQDDPIVAVLPPKFTQSPPKPVLKQFADSYGYKNAFHAPTGVLARLTQRGIEEALNKSEIAYTTVVSSDNLNTSQLVPSMTSMWYLNTVIHSLYINQDETNQDVLDMQISLALSRNSDYTVNSAGPAQHCHVRMSVAQDVDGYWAVTLERGSMKVAMHFLHRKPQNGITINCSDHVQ